MERQVRIADDQKVGADDFINFGQFPTDSLDHVTHDGIVSEKAFVGFTVVKTASAKVAIDAGRLYDGGRVFFNDDSGGTVLDFALSLPSVGKRYVAILAFGQQSNASVESREFLVTVEPLQTEVRQTATEVRRRAVLDKVFGAESASPLKPVVDSQYLTIAWVLLSPTGVDSIEVNSDALLRSATDAYALAKATGQRVDTVFPKLVDIEQDISKLAKRVNSTVAEDVFIRALQDIADLKDIAGLPDAYVDYGSDTFLDTDESKTTASGYAAKIGDGLRFPDALTSTMELALLNTLDSKVYKTSKGMILPSWKDTRYRYSIYAGEFALNSVSFNSNLSILLANPARERRRFGAEFTVSSASAWWKTGRYTNVAAQIFQKGGETFQVFPTNRYNADGTQIFRVAQFWVENYPSAYWTLTSEQAAVAGFQFAQTFLNPSDRWLSALTIHLTRKDASGAITLLVCECDESGKPNEKMVIGQATVQPSAVNVNQYTRVPLDELVFLEQGKQYAYIVSSPGNHWFGYALPDNYRYGSLFYRTGAGYWAHDPSKILAFDLWIAEFDNTRTEVDLQPIQLLGGVAAIDLIAEMLKPEGSSATIEVQVGSKWYALAADQTENPLAALQALVPCRMVFQGGVNAQAGVRLTGSKLVASRPAAAMRHQSVTRTLASSATKINTVTLIENFNAAKHTVQPRIIVGGATQTPGVISDRVVAAGVIERTARFVLGSATTTFDQLTIAATTDIAELPVIGKCGYTAIP